MVESFVEDCFWGDDASALDARIVVKLFLLELGEWIFGYPGLAVGVGIDEERQEVRLSHFRKHFLPFLLLFLLLENDLVLVPDDGGVDGVHVELRLLLVLPEALLPGQRVLSHETARQLLFDLRRTHLVEEPLVAQPPCWRQLIDVHALRNLLQFLAQVHCLEAAVTED